MKKKTRTIFIGDIHGCYDELILLLEKLNITKNDQVYLTGDLILKGKKSVKVLKYAFENDLLWVKGNKEHEILNGIKSGTYFSKEEKKLGEKLKEKHPKLIKYLKNAPYYIETTDFILVHGGILPGIPLSDQSPKDLCYLRELKNKAWYEHYNGDKKVIYGHWALDGLRIRTNTIGLDSGCVYGGKLTAYILETGEIVQQNALKIYKNPFKKGSLSYYLKLLQFKFSKLSAGK